MGVGVRGTRRANLWLGIASVALGALLMEGFLGVVSPRIYRIPRVWEHDARLGWWHRPGARGRLIEPELDVEVAINSHGLRGPEVALEKPAGTRRIALFGDSFAEGWGVEEEATLRAQLDGLRRPRGQPVEVLNFGVAGYGTDQALLAWTERGAAFRPDVVVLLFYTNDLWDNGNQRGIGGRGLLVPKPFFRAPPGGGLVLGGVPVPRVPGWDSPRVGSAEWRAGLWPAVQQRSHVLSLVGQALAPIYTAPRDPRYFAGLYGAPDPRSRAAWELTGRILAAFAEAVERSGARFLVVYVPANVEVEPETWRRAREQNGLPADLDLERPSRELARLAREAEFAWVDLLPAFRAAPNPEPLYLREGHWNAGGHALAARELDRAIGPLR